MQDAAGEIERPAHAAREGADAVVAAVAQPEQRSAPRRCAAQPSRSREAVEARAVAQILLGGEIEVERRLLEDDPDAACARPAGPRRRPCPATTARPRAWAAAASSACGSSSSCRPRWGRGSRRTRPGAPRDRSPRRPGRAVVAAEAEGGDCGRGGHRRGAASGGRRAVAAPGTRTHPAARRAFARAPRSGRGGARGGTPGRSPRHRR